MISTSVDTDLDPREQTICRAIAEVHKLWERVVGSVRLDDAPHVLVVGGALGGVGVVRLEGLDIDDEVFGVEQLADVRDGAALSSAVLTQRDIRLGQQMCVGGAAIVVAWEDGLEGDDAVFVGLLDAPEEGAVETALARLHAGVNARGITVPDVDVEATDRLAGVDVDVLDVEVEVDAGLTLFDVRAHKLTEDVVGSSGDFRSEYAGGVGGEDGCGVGVEGVVELACHVVVHGFESLEVGEITAELLGVLMKIKYRLSRLQV